MSEQAKANQMLHKLIDPHVDCQDLTVSTLYSPKKQAHNFKITSQELNFTVEIDVTEQSMTCELGPSVLQVARSFLAEFQKKHPKRYIEDAE